MRTLQWQKIPIASVIGKANLWTMLGRMGKDYEMDYSKMDALFSVNQNGGPKRQGQVPETGPEGKKKKDNVEINILDGKRSLNVNIFLKQFRMSHEEIVQLVRDGRSQVFGAERLRGLLKLLPSQDEIDAIKAFDGDREKLGNAEKFFIHMMGLPNYRMRIEGLLIMEEFNANMEWIRPSIEAVIQASKDIQENKSLKELIFLILMSGNYLNSGNYAGNAAGFKLSSLLKLTELRANKPRMNLLHYVAQEAKEKNPKLLDFPEEMKFLRDASQVSVETLSQDIGNITSKVKAITEQIVVAGVDFQKQMEEFLRDANVEVVDLEEDLKDIELMRSELATFFAEDGKSFKLEECFKILQTFCERFQKAISENSQREIQEKKAEARRKMTEEEKAKRNSKELPESPDDSLDQSTSQEDEDGSIVDMLLADVRSGFTSRKFNDGNFSVQKVTKVNLLDALSTGTGVVSTPSPSETFQEAPSFIRGGYGRISQRKKQLSTSGESPCPSPTPESGLNQRRNRRSYATEDNESLIDFLMESEKSAAPEPMKPETTFERCGSLRRRHQERKEKRRHALEVIIPGRELAPSPSITDSPSNACEVQSAIVVGQGSLENEADKKSGRGLRRTRSLLDKASVDKANADLRVRENKDDLDSSDALLDRIKQKLNRRSEERHARLGSPDENNSERLTVHNTAEVDSSVSSSRWRGGISVPDAPLEPITEKTSPGQYPSVVHRHADRAHSLNSRDTTKLRYRNSIDPSEFTKMIPNTERVSQPRRSQDDSDMHSPSVAVSVRKQISSGMGTNIDQVLKTIEDSGRTIDTVGVSGPIKRTPAISEHKMDSKAQLHQPQQQVAVVAHVSQPARSVTPIAEQDLKAKRDKRKKRSTLSLEDVRAAMKTDGPAQVDTMTGKSQSDNDMVDSNNERNGQSMVYYQAETGKPVAKTPPSPRRPTTEAVKVSKGNPVNNKELSRAAKLAAKKKFRDARFGDSTSNSEKDRAKSNVEADGVNKALKEMANKTTMSRSKSYDEQVAKNDTELNNATMRGSNSGSTPDTTEEKKSMKRNSTSRLSLDGRRNGLYIPSDESDTELTPEDAGTHRLSISSKSESPHSVSQLSLKSTNTSTETLEADIESSPEQKRKSSGCLSQNPTSESEALSKPLSQETQPTPTNFLGKPMDPRPQSTTAIDLEESGLRRSYSLMERTKLHNDDDDSDNPLAKMAKWRMNRNKHRRSIYDNVPEMDTSNPSTPNRSLLSPNYPLSPESLQPFKTEVNELKNEVGSRSSYASSYASSNERDEGFETGSGTASQRNSMSSTIDSDIYAGAAAATATLPTATPSRRGEPLRSKLSIDKTNSEESVIKTLPESDSVISSLSVEADRKERTETWTEQTVRANSIGGISKDQTCDSNSDYSALSPDSGHSTSKEDIWSEDLNSKSDKTQSKKESMAASSGSKASVTKSKSVPNYMKSTSSSSSTLKSSRSSVKSSATNSTPPSVSSFKRDTPQRISFKEKQTLPTIQRDASMRASMRAEPTSTGFQRGTIARKSVRGPRTSVGGANGTTKTTTSPSVSGTLATRPRTDSTNSLSSTASSASNISTNVKSSTTRRLSSSSTARPTTPSSNSTASVSMRARTPVNTPASTRSSGTLSRTQSMRVKYTTSASSLQEPKKKTLAPTLSDSTTKRRSMTPLSHEMKRSSTPLSHELKRSSTPLSHEMKRSSTPLSHDGSRSTTPLPERPRSTTPMSEARASSRRTSFMAPTAASKAKKELSDSTSSKPKTSPTKSGPLLRTASLRMPRKTSEESPKSSLTDLSGGRRSPAVVESPLQQKGEHYQSLSTVAEQDEEKESSRAIGEEKKSPSLLKRIGIVKGKTTSTTASKARSKTPSTVSSVTKKK